MMAMGLDPVPIAAMGGLTAALAALAWGGGARLLRWRRIATAAVGLGLVAGLVVLLGFVGASPRQLPERLPALAALGLVAGLIADGGRVRRVGGSLLGLAAGAWWMAGAPLHPDTLLRAAPVGLGLLAGMALAWRGGATAPPMAVAWAALAAGLAVAGARGPFFACALAGLGAMLGAALAGVRHGMAARLPLALSLAGVAAVPVLARTAPQDIAAAAVPALALLAGPAVAARLPGRIGPWLGPALAAVPALVAAVVFTR